jgi:hypothetical protein
LTQLCALLANEAGGGRGHVTHLAAAARALGPGVRCIAALARDTYAAELAGLCDPVLTAPLLARPKGVDGPVPGFRGSADLGDILAAIGLADPAKVRRGLAFWRETIVRHDISLLIADFAPLALWAAKGLRDEGWAIRCVAFGVGYTVPPIGLETFPPYLPGITRRLHAEPETLAVLNKIGAGMGLDPLPRLAALYDVDLSLATGFAAFDPFADHRPPQGRIPPLVPKSAALAGEGDEIFVYFSTAELRDEALVQALTALPMPRRGYLPSASPEVKTRLQASGMELLDQPASADAIAARSRLILHAAPQGTVSLALLAGLPQFAVPQHLEQLFNAKRAESLEVLAYAMPGSPDLADRIAVAYADRAMADRAKAVAQDLRRDHPSDALAILSRRLEPEVAAARAGVLRP